MSFINTSSAVFVYVNGTDVSQYLIEGSLSDDSAYASTIITTRGQIILGTDLGILDFDRTSFPIGSRVSIWVRLDNGRLALHPKGTLYVINSTVNVEQRTLILDVGCSLAFISDKEDSYQSGIESLFDDLISDESKDLYIIERKDLPTLSTFLDAEGSILYQDAYGNIQKVRAFGGDGSGINIGYGKLVSFDKYTAISIESISETSFENSVSSITVETSVEVPTAELEIEDPEEEDPATGPVPPPFITSVTNRTILLPTLVPSIWSTAKGAAWIEQDSSEELISETNPKCGTVRDPLEEPTGVGYNYKAFGRPIQQSLERKETVTSGNYVSYGGPGNQVDREETWEWSSAPTWGENALTNSINDHIEYINYLISEANALCSKANQHFDARDREQITAINRPTSKYLYHDCNATTFLERAEQMVRQAQFWMESGRWLAPNMEGVMGLANLTQTFNSYGPGDALTKQITKNYLPDAAKENARLGTFTFSVAVNQFTYTDVIDRSGRIEMPTGAIDNPSYYKMFLANEKIVNYTYNNIYTIEEEEYIDYVDPKRSYTRVSYSSTGSTNAEQPDRLIEATNLDGQQFCTRTIGSEQEELSVTVPVTGQVEGSVGWFGAAKAYEKTVSFPLSFTPIAPLYDEETNTCQAIVFDTAERIAKYEEALKRYAEIQAKKIIGDNRGFRITEKLRAELFEYYPFYSVRISLESIGRAFSARAVASNWVFDSETAVCSLDCLVTGDVRSPVFADPSRQAVYIKTETTKVITTSDVKVPITADTITVTSLPETGSLVIDGFPVSIGQTITVSDLESNLLEFVPSEPGTSEIIFTYTSEDSSGNEISSDHGIYPPNTIIQPTIDNYFADGGEFTLGSTNGGFDCDAGDLDTSVSLGGPSYMEAGDFDIGGTVTLPLPAIPPTAPSGNNSANPETDYGIFVEDRNGTLIATDTLPVPEGALDPALNIIVSFKIQPAISAKLSLVLSENLGWDYGHFAIGRGTPADLGTISASSSYDLDFGTIATAAEPVLPSSVV